MNRSESIAKWIIAIFVIFGLLTTFFLLRWGTVLKVSLIIISIVLIGNILIQSGRGGGLAAIGGLSDQSMMGTKTGSFLGSVTFLFGAAFFVTVIFLSKVSVDSKLHLGLPATDVSIGAPDHEHGNEESAKSEEASMGMSEVDSSVGMQGVDEKDAKDESHE